MGDLVRYTHYFLLYMFQFDGFQSIDWSHEETLSVATSQSVSKVAKTPHLSVCPTSPGEECAIIDVESGKVGYASATFYILRSCEHCIHYGDVDNYV